MSIVDCEVHVTAGSGGRSVRTPPVLRAKSRMFGVESPMRFGESPTMLMTQVRTTVSDGTADAVRRAALGSREFDPALQRADRALPSPVAATEARRAPPGRAPGQVYGQSVSGGSPVLWHRGRRVAPRFDRRLDRLPRGCRSGPQYPTPPGGMGAKRNRASYSSSFLKTAIALTAGFACTFQRLSPSLNVSSRMPQVIA